MEGQRVTTERSAAPTGGWRRPFVTALGRVVWASILPVILVAAYGWWAGSAANPYFPPIGRMLTSFVDTWVGAGFTQHVVPSLWNLVRGYIAGLALGVLGGVAIGRLPRVRAALDPEVNFVLTIPAVALLPLFLILLGVGSQLQVVMIAFSVFFYVLVTTANAIRGIEPVLLDTAAVFRVQGWRRLLLVYIPSAIPEIVSAARVTLSMAVLVMVVSEMSGASRGIGAVTLLSQQSFAYDTMWAGMLLLALIGIGSNALFAALERAVLTRVGDEQPTQTGVIR